MNERTGKGAIKNFAPSWFSVVMGTGILAITSTFYAQYIPVLKSIAVVLFYVNIAAFIVIFVFWMLRWVLFPKNALADLKHPIIANFYATFAIGILVLSANFLIIGRNIPVAKYLWLIGEHISPGWFIPPIGLVIIPMVGSAMIEQFSGGMRDFVIFINYFVWGSGFFLYLALLAITLYRFILHPPLPRIFAPVIWMNLGPVGVGTVSLVGLITHTDFITTKEPFYVFGFILWGFGIWWLLMAILLTLHYTKKMRIPYNLSWWAFTFPLGAYVAASHTIGTIFKLPLVDHIGFALYFLLFALWLVTAVNTFRHGYRGGFSE